MPKISQRGTSMPSSPIRKLVPFAEGAKAAGKQVYHLNIGQPDIQTPEHAMDAVRNFDEKVLAYSHSAGNESYRKKLVNYYSRFGVDINLSEVMVTTGGSEALLFGLFSCLDAGDEIIIPEPFYANYNGFSVSGGIVVKPIEAKIEDGFALPPISEFENLITEKTRAILICNPNNPTGYLYSKEELDQLRDIVLKHDLFLFADEVYREFAYDGKEHISILTYPELKNNAVVVDSVSKRYSACGARIGAIVSRNAEVMNTALKFAQARLSPPTLAQVVAEAAIDTPDTYFAEVLEEYKSRRDVVIQRLEQMQDVQCPVPGGAFYAVAQLPIDDADAFCQWLLESFEHENQTIMLAPATGFYSTDGSGKQEVRIAYVLEKGSLEKAMDCLERALEVYPGKVVGDTHSTSDTLVEG